MPYHPRQFSQYTRHRLQQGKKPQETFEKQPHASLPSPDCQIQLWSPQHQIWEFDIGKRLRHENQNKLQCFEIISRNPDIVSQRENVDKLQHTAHRIITKINSQILDQMNGTKTTNIRDLQVAATKLHNSNVNWYFTCKKNDKNDNHSLMHRKHTIAIKFGISYKSFTESFSSCFTMSNNQTGGGGEGKWKEHATFPFPLNFIQLLIT